MAALVDRLSYRAARAMSALPPAAHRRFGGMIHGFINFAGVSRISRDAVIEVAGSTRALLG